MLDMEKDMNSAAYWFRKMSITFTLIGLLSCLNHVALADTTSISTAIADKSSATNMANPMGMTDLNAGYATATKVIAPSAGHEKSEVDTPAFATQVPLAKEDVSDFQRFVQMATGRQLNRFGQDLFREVSSTYAPVQNIPVTPDYLVGPGDELLIRAWGSISLEVRAPVDRNGQIYVPKIGAINVAGIRAGDIESFLKSRIGRVFRNFDLNVTMGQLRSLQIYVVGHARRPGTYTLSSLSTLVNALFASGGPNATGTMRHVQLKRDGAVIADLDLYDFITKGDKQADIHLMPGDILVIPPVGPQVAVIGPERLQAIYEIKDAHETVGDVVRYGGGLPVLTSKHLALLERLDPNRVPARNMQDIDLDKKGMDLPMQDGDILTMLSVSPEIPNAVTLRGNVAAPIRYPYRPGMRVHDLIPNREALIPPDYFQSKNQLVQFSKAGREITKEKLINDVKTLLDEVNWEYAAIERLDPQNLTEQLIPFNLAKAMEGDPKNNLALQPGDVVTIFSTKDVRVPQAKTTRLVRVEGEVVSPGIYQAQPGETLRQLVMRIGGLAPNEYLYGAQFFRESTRIEQQNKLDQVLDRMQRSLAQSASNQTASALSPEDAATREASLKYQQQTLANMRTVKATGRIVLDIPPNAESIAQLPDLPLEDGDRLYIPPRPSVVQVMGGVNNESAYIYNPDMNVNAYVNLAGGLSDDANKDGLYVIRADGSAIARESQGWFAGWSRNMAIYAGDTIVVPIRTEAKFSWTKEFKDWTQILYQFGLGAAGISVIKNL
jgi:protein involved in polysaccharide export with SLBB domain